ncbi:MAG: AI-2E family transporter [Actinomycetota bacterium]|nr:AI-2E family transporter [Actinomycetota bacterium]
MPRPLRVASAISWRFLAIAAALSVLGYVAVTLSALVIPLAVALLLSALLAPLVGLLVRYRVPPGLATATVLVGGIVVIGGVLTYVVQAFVRGLPELRQQVSGSLQTIREYLDDPPFGLPPVELLDQLTTYLSENQGTVTSGAVSTAVSVGYFLGGLVLTIFALIIFLARGRAIWQFVVKLVPSESRDRADTAGRQSFAAVGSYARATFLVALVDAVGIGLGLLLVGAPLVVPLTALVFLASFVPIAGAVISGAVAVLVVLVANGPVSALIILGVVVGVQQLESNVLQPMVMGRAVHLNALAVVLAVSVGTLLVGITGAVLAVPLLAALNAGIRSLTSEGPPPPEPGSTSDPTDTGTEGAPAVDDAPSSNP